MILYLHGFCSSPASWKARLLGEEMQRRGQAAQFACPQLPPFPDEAIACASRLIEDSPWPVTLVGSSLGGHYANHLAEKYALPALLINPAAVDRLDTTKFIGEHANFHNGERFTFTANHAAQFQAQVRTPTPSRYWLWLETGDEVLDYHQAQAFYLGCRQSVFEGGDHSFTRFADMLPKLLDFAGI